MYTVLAKTNICHSRDVHVHASGVSFHLRLCSRCYFHFFYLLKSSVKCKRFVFLIFPMLCGQLGHNQKSFSSEIWKPSLAGVTICVHMSDNRIFFEKIVCTLGCLLMFAYCGFMEHLFILSTLSFLSLLSLLVSIFFWVGDIVTFWLVCLSLDREMIWAIFGVRGCTKFLLSLQSQSFISSLVIFAILQCTSTIKESKGTLSQSSKLSFALLWLSNYQFSLPWLICQSCWNM